MKRLIESFIAICASVAAILSGYLIFFQQKEVSSLKSANNVKNSTSHSSSDTTKESTQESSQTLKDGTYTGVVVSTDRGDYQVQMTVSAGKMTAIDILEYPNENSRSEQINSSSLPTYTAQAIENQSASVNQISGATEAYRGFTGSLQDALNQAES